jgi:hypothetical protein
MLWRQQHGIDGGSLREKGKKRGFALIVTISLMVLLTIIAVGLLSLSAIELRLSSGSKAQSIARANARMALLIALGDLQRAAGPDQRVTATADIAAADDGTSADAGQAPENALALDGSRKGLSSVQPGTRYWTGVFTNRDDPKSIYKKTPAARIVRWLVSGAQDPDATGTLEITPASQACAVGTDGTVQDPTKAAVLVGPNTVGTGPDSPNQYVAVPMVQINSRADSSANSKPQGRFAYWVGDEGVKARINMERTNEDSESYGSLVAQRRGWETVEGFADYPPPASNAAHNLPAIVTVPTAELLIPSLGSGSPSPQQSVFHSATTESRGLLVDTLDGGTRVDLTAAFSQGLPTRKPADVFDNYPVADGRVIPSQAFSRLRHLKWNHLEKFFKLGTENSSATLLVTSCSGPDTAAIAPIVTDFRILMGVRMESAGRGSRPTGNYKVFPCGKIAIAIANPYPLPLEWKDDLEFEIKNQTPPGNRPSRIWQLNSTCVYIPKDGTIDRPGRESAVFNQTVFRIKHDRLEPGEARAYTQSGKVIRKYRTANSRQIVDMAPFSGSAPFDFNNCVEMTTPTEITLPKALDVRESWQTTLVMLEMRLAGSRGRYKWLRRIERFELDNGYFYPNQRTFDSSTTRRMRGPVPLMLYSFQISQPGMDYLSLMPRGYEMGQRASTLRTFADFNLQATNISKPITSYNPPPYFMESNDSKALLPFRPPGGDTGRGFTRNLAVSPLHWGRSSKSGSDKTVLFSIPRQFSSLAQFQHADLTNDDRSISIGHQPGNAFANSYATPFVKRSATYQRRVDYEIIGSPNHSGANQTRRNYYDISHILNSCLWDRYFFSTIPYGGGLPENPTLVAVPGAGKADLDDPSKVAGKLMINGAFNINSTDKNAWKAFLASAKHFKHQADTGASAEAAFPRSLEQPDSFAIPPSGQDNDSFSGYRRLTDKELDDLATELVRQVRLRGPFVSLSHFVNRALADINDERELTRCGALQFALDESGINISHDGKRNGFQGISSRKDRVTLAAKQGAPRADLDGGDLSDRPRDADSKNPDWAKTSRDNNFGAVASILADREMLTNRRMKSEQGYRSTGIPGWVTQADVLQVIGPAISARSDTFRIRAIGEACDVDGKVIATAYCEAIVQRQPSFVDPVNRPYDRIGALNRTNTTYGRRFEIVSFRWLSPNEI